MSANDEFDRKQHFGQRIVAETAARDSGADLTVSDASVAMPTLLDVLDFNRV